VEWLKEKALSSSPSTTKKKVSLYMINCSIHQKDRTIIDLYIPYNITSKYKIAKGKSNRNKIKTDKVTTLSEILTHLAVTDRSISKG
jgi:hypothetical protein